MSKGKFVIISGPSGSGKTTVVEMLLRDLPDATRVVTLTTRAARPGEKDGVDFYFVSRDEFEKRIQRDEMLEYDDHFGNYYGTSKPILEEALAKHAVVFGVLDIKGAEQIKRVMPECTTIFLLPGSMEELRVRLVRREGGETPVVTRRLARAAEEIAVSAAYDFRVKNPEGKLPEAVREIEKIIRQ